MAKTLFALDIDETLNSAVDHKLLCDADAAGDDEATYPEQFNQVLKFFNVSNGGNRQVHDLGMYVNIHQLAAMNALREEVTADVVGTSSWFGGGRDDLKVAEFLGIPLDKFISTKYTCGGVGRCFGLAGVLLAGRYERLLVLDDQYFGWELFGLDEHRPAINGAEGFNAACIQEARTILSIPVDLDKVQQLHDSYLNR